MATLLREPRMIEPVKDDDVPPPRYWLEPPEVRAEIEGWLGERGLKIAEYDPCPYPLQDGFDGLEVDWPCGPDEVIRINAPFHRSDELRGRGLGAWLRKAKLEAAKGRGSRCTFRSYLRRTI